jgi:hypothetical protein
MRIIKYRFTNPTDGAEYGGLSTTLKEAERTAQSVTGIQGSWWSKNSKFEWEVLQFNRKTDELMEALHMAMEFAHDLHEIAPRDIPIVKRPKPEHLRGPWKEAV